MRGFAEIVLALVGTAAAQSTTVVEVVNPYFGHNPYDASVVDANPTATTYAVYCQPDSAERNDYHCWDTTDLAMTLVGGPSTVEVYIQRPKTEFSEEFIGTISGDRLDYRVIATLRGNVTSTDMVLSPVTMLDARVPLTITAGIEKLKAQATAMTTTTTATTTTATAKGPNGAQTGPTATGAEAAPTSTPNAAASRAGRNGNLAGFAIVAAVAGVVLLF